MIQRQQAIELLLEACPSFAASHAEHIANNGNDLPYVAAGVLARHLLELHQSGEVGSLEAVGRAVEILHLEGDPWVREFATIGVLEGIQNAWSNAGVEPDEFATYLGPECLGWWRGLNEFWSGKEPHVRAASASDA